MSQWTKYDPETGLTVTQHNKIEALIDYSARRTLQAKVIGSHSQYGGNPAWFDAQVEIFATALKRNINLIMSAVKQNMTMQLFRELQHKQLQDNATVLSNELKKQRDGLASRLYHAREKLRVIKREIEGYEAVLEPYRSEAEYRKQTANQIRRARMRLRTLQELARMEVELLPKKHQLAIHLSRFGPVPEPSITPHIQGQGLPEESGVYFLWKNGVVDYVGQSVRLNKRVTLGSHHVLVAEHQISYVLADPTDLDWTECFYIGICQPEQNFGARRNQYRVKAQEQETA